MNKHRLRAFAFGIIFTVSVVGFYLYFFDNPTVADNYQKQENFTAADAEKLLKKEDKVVLTSAQYDELKTDSEKLAGLEKEQNANEKKSPEAEEKAEEGKKKDKDGEENKKITYTLLIKTGMSSEDIAETLEKEKIIDDSVEFNNYLAINDLSKSIQLGSFDLNNQMSFVEISQKITK